MMKLTIEQILLDRDTEFEHKLIKSKADKRFVLKMYEKLVKGKERVIITAYDKYDYANKLVIITSKKKAESRFLDCLNYYKKYNTIIIDKLGIIMQSGKKEEIIKVLELKEVEDAKFGENKIYGLKFKNKTLGLIFKDSNTVEILEFKKDQGFKRLIRSAANKIEDVYDLRIALGLVLDREDMMVINSYYKKNIS